MEPEHKALPAKKGEDAAQATAIPCKWAALSEDALTMSGRACASSTAGTFAVITNM